MTDFLTNPLIMLGALAISIVAACIAAYNGGKAVAEAEAEVEKLEKELVKANERTKDIIKADKAADAVRDMPSNELRKPDANERI